MNALCVLFVRALKFRGWVRGKNTYVLYCFRLVRTPCDCVLGEVRWGLFKQRGRGSEGERLRGGMGEIESVKQRERD